MSDQWFYARGGQQTGPVTIAQLSELARSGGLATNDLVWREGTPNWQAAGEVPGLFSAAPAGYPSAPPAHSAPVPAQPVGYSGPYQPQYQAHAPGSVPNYLWQSIVVTILCCWPFGIPAIVFAAQVNGKLAQGDYQGALHASKQAKMWCWISFGLGFGVGLIYLVLVIIGAANA